MVSRGDHERHVLEFSEVGSGLLVLSDLGPLRQISSHDDYVGGHPSRQLEKTGGYSRSVGFAEVNVRPV